MCAGHDVNGPITVNPPVNPNAGVTTYDCAGDKRWSGPTATSGHTESLIVGAESDAAKKMLDLTNAHDYAGVLDLCQQKIKSAPEWLTPYLFCSAAYLLTGDKAKAKKMIEHYDSNVGANYQGDVVCKQVADYVHANIGN